MFRGKLTFASWTLGLVQDGHYNYSEVSWLNQSGLNVHIQIVFKQIKNDVSI